MLPLMMFNAPVTTVIVTVLCTVPTTTAPFKIVTVRLKTVVILGVTVILGVVCPVDHAKEYDVLPAAGG